MDKLFSAALSERQPHVSQLLTAAVERDKLAHAYLLTGRALDDKWLIARHLAHYMNCMKEDRHTRGSCLADFLRVHRGESDTSTAPAEAIEAACQNCRWLYLDEHPKAWYVLSAEAGKSGKIPVEAARNLSEELSRITNYTRVVVVEEANEYALHRPCANALLKTIEEPKSPCLFLLFSQSQDSVLQTIVSRCQVVPLVNDREKNLGLLQQMMAGGPISSQVKDPVDGEIWAQIEGLKREEFFAGTYSFDNGRLTFKSRGGASPKSALALAAKLVAILDEELEAEILFDALIEAELSLLDKAQLQQIIVSPVFSRFFSSLMAQNQEAIRQINQYVGKKAVCESLVLRWHELRHNLK